MARHCSGAGRGVVVPVVALVSVVLLADVSGASRLCSTAVASVEASPSWKAAEEALYSSLNVSSQSAESPYRGTDDGGEVVRSISYGALEVEDARRACEESGFTWSPGSSVIEIGWIPGNGSSGALGGAGEREMQTVSGTFPSCLPKDICTCTGPWDWEAPTRVRTALLGDCTAHHEVFCTNAQTVTVDVTTTSRCGSPNPSAPPSFWASPAGAGVIVGATLLLFLVVLVGVALFLRRQSGSGSHAAAEPGVDGESLLDWSSSFAGTLRGPSDLLASASRRRATDPPARSKPISAAIIAPAAGEASTPTRDLSYSLPPTRAGDRAFSRASSREYSEDAGEYVPPFHVYGDEIDPADPIADLAAMGHDF